MKRRSQTGAGPDGVLLVDKPDNCTSHDVVEAVRRRLPGVRIGHAGTLDPFATGLLPLSLGRATRLTSWLIACEKVYQGWVRLGVATDTYDSTGKPQGEHTPFTPDEPRLREVLQGLSGERMQVPPPFSAKKVNGVPLYRRARRGEHFEPDPVRVRIELIELLQIATETFEFRVTCSSGTYIRTLAHDVGRELGCGAYLQALTRLRCGEFRLSDALPLSDLLALDDAGLRERVIAPRGLNLGLPALHLTAEESSRLSRGQTLAVRSLPGEICRALRPDGELLAIVIHQKPPDGLPRWLARVVFRPGPAAMSGL
ncbi:MAG: tRNA pseudouridine(55) synthase TruB [Acidobacteriota bacterium]|nr:tRNA pseudouridine(55) synthase TruB [Acidobacteriota bacterium]